MYRQREPDPNFGLIAAAALMVDYVMTVAVVQRFGTWANLGTAFRSIPLTGGTGALVIILVTAATSGASARRAHLRPSDLFGSSAWPCLRRRGW